MSRTYTFNADVMRANPVTKTTSSSHTTGSHNQYRLGRSPDANTKISSSPTWISRCWPFAITAVSGINSRGTVTRLMRCALSTSETVPEISPTEKKLNGTNPQSTKTALCGIDLSGNRKV